MALSGILRHLAVLFVAGLLTGVQAAPDVRVVGLFSGRAVVLVNGRQHILVAGQSGPEGVRLLSADSESALLEIDGREVEARLDGRVSARKRMPETQEFQVWRNNAGMYTTVGSINGLPVSFLVDTGASQVALNAGEARRLGIDFRVSGTPTSVGTASGVARAWAVTLDSVKVGSLEVRNVGAVVLEGNTPQHALLGMTYLGRLEIDNDGRLMTLRKKY
ncbi:MAG TPA: TIGR02281 family clan AA aspartic protease [Gammaproteobacteria bacterium]|nr:TIGR02281 family clan AA aspartic protease [Gammaproteobacteria bacterium]